MEFATGCDKIAHVINHIGHVPIPLSTAGSSIATVVRELTREHALTGGVSTVAVADNRDLRVESARNLEVDFTETCPREWFTRTEYMVDHVVGMLGGVRPFGGHVQDPAIRAMCSAQPDVVLVHEGHYAAATLPSWRRNWPEVRLVLYVHNPLSRAYAWPELRRLINAADGLVFVSARSRDEFLRRWHGPAPRTAIVHNGVNTQVFHDRGRSESDRLRITFAGQVSPHKGVHVMLDAVARGAKDALVRVVGSSVHMKDLPLSDYEKQLRSQAESLRLNVEFVPFGSQERLAAILRDTDIACVPSLWDEPFGMAALEAMACGAAVIASDRGGLPEACGGAAELLNPEDIDAFADAIESLNTPGVMSDMQRRGLERSRVMSWACSYRSLVAALESSILH